MSETLTKDALALALECSKRDTIQDGVLDPSRTLANCRASLLGVKLHGATDRAFGKAWTRPVLDRKTGESSNKGRSGGSVKNHRDAAEWFRTKYLASVSLEDIAADPSVFAFPTGLDRKTLVVLMNTIRTKAYGKKSDPKTGLAASVSEPFTAKKAARDAVRFINRCRKDLAYDQDAVIALLSDAVRSAFSVSDGETVDLATHESVSESVIKDVSPSETIAALARTILIG